MGYSPWGCKESGTTERLTFTYLLTAFTSLVAQLAKNPPTMQEAWVRSLSYKDPLEKGKATHSSILAWRIPWIVAVVHSPWGRKESDMTEQLSF